MAVMVWDPQAQAFKDAEAPKIWDSENQAWKESAGLVWNEEAQAWQKVWSPGPEVLYLYKAGDECTEITGGWTVTMSGNDSIAQKKSNGIRMKIYSYPSAAGVITNESVRVSGFSKLCIEFTSSNYISDNNDIIFGHFGLNNVKNAVSYPQSSIVVGTNKWVSRETGTHISAVNVSNVSGLYYVMGQLSGGYYDGLEVLIHNIWLEL